MYPIEIADHMVKRKCLSIIESKLNNIIEKYSKLKDYSLEQNILSLEIIEKLDKDIEYINYSMEMAKDDYELIKNKEEEIALFNDLWKDIDNKIIKERIKNINKKIRNLENIKNKFENIEDNISKKISPEIIEFMGKMRLKVEKEISDLLKR